MVQLTLPKNSTIRTGKTWPRPECTTNVRLAHAILMSTACHMENVG
jgi:hypothetical protein